MIRSTQPCVCGGFISVAQVEGETAEDAIQRGVKAHNAMTQHVSWRLGYAVDELDKAWTPDGQKVMRLRDRDTERTEV